MQLTPDKIALLAVAGVVVFWPQLAPWAASVFSRVRGVGNAGVPATPGDRPAVVTQLLRLQDTARALGKPGAADLIGQAIVDIVADPKPPRGGK